MKKTVFWSVLCFLPLFLMLLAIWTGVDLSRIRKKKPPLREFVSTGKGEIHYIRRGPEGQTVIMIHGRDGALQEFTYSIFSRTAEQFDTIALDRPGYGYSDRPDKTPLTLENQAKILHEALSNLKVEDPILVGHSYGGTLVLQYLLNYPDEAAGALLLGPVAYLDEETELSRLAFPNISLIGAPAVRTVLVPLGKGTTQTFYETAFAPEPVNQPFVDEMFLFFIRPAGFIATAKELALMRKSVQAISPLYKEITAPVIIMAGRDDRVVPCGDNAERLAATLPRARLILVDGGGHKFHHYHQKEVLEALEELSRSSPE